MERLHEPDPSPSASQARAPYWVERWHRLSPLARDIVIVLVVKVVVLYFIWFAFFRAPVARHMTMDPNEVAQQIAGPRDHPESAHAVR